MHLVHFMHKAVWATEQTITHLSHPKGKFVYLVNRHKSVHIIKQEDIMKNGDKKGQGAIQHSCGDTQAKLPIPHFHLFLHSPAPPLLFLNQQNLSQSTKQPGCGHHPRQESCGKKNKQSALA